MALKKALVRGASPSKDLYCPAGFELVFIPEKSVSGLYPGWGDAAGGWGGLARDLE